ncbi:MAG TPA: hypothetical protein VLM37_13295 [Fibrobacteraceae bacterium]|nr:hypothetical protein [Fibrobacteraceae bacterium]
MKNGLIGGLTIFSALALLGCDDGTSNTSGLSSSSSVSSASSTGGACQAQIDGNTFFCVASESFGVESCDALQTSLQESLGSGVSVASLAECPSGYVDTCSSSDVKGAYSYYVYDASYSDDLCGDAEE